MCSQGTTSSYLNSDPPHRCSTYIVFYRPRKQKEKKNNLLVASHYIPAHNLSISEPLSPTVHESESNQLSVAAYILSLEINRRQTV